MSGRRGQRGWPGGGDVSHVLRNALIPVVTVLGLQFAGLLGARCLSRTCLPAGDRPAGRQCHRDARLSAVQGIVLFTAVVYALVNLAVTYCTAF